MIDVVYFRDHNRVTIKGHAMSGEAGHDLVCASASILAYTIANAVMQAEICGQVRGTVHNLCAGDTEIACRPVRKFCSVITLIFDTLCAGFDLLAQHYPGNVRYEVRG